MLEVHYTSWLWHALQQSRNVLLLLASFLIGDILFVGSCIVQDSSSYPNGQGQTRIHKK